MVANGNPESSVRVCLVHDCEGEMRSEVDGEDALYLGISPSKGQE